VRLTSASNRVRNHSEGNDFFKKGDWAAAVAKYTEAVEIDGSNHVYYSNRR
jgi:stress-induced-phosphoprotein 1